VHALARIMLHGRIDHIQTIWVKLGVERTQVMLRGGVNDLGGTLTEETISRMAGSENGTFVHPAVNGVARSLLRVAPGEHFGEDGEVVALTCRVDFGGERSRTGIAEGVGAVSVFPAHGPLDVGAGAACGGGEVV
jgi:hypothetical protein